MRVSNRSRRDMAVRTRVAAFAWALAASSAIVLWFVSGRADADSGASASRPGSPSLIRSSPRAGTLAERLGFAPALRARLRRGAAPKVQPHPVVSEAAYGPEAGGGPDRPNPFH